MKSVSGKLHRLKLRHTIEGTPKTASITLYTCLSWFVQKQNLGEVNDEYKELKENTIIHHNYLFLKNFINNKDKLDEEAKKFEEVKQQMYNVPEFKEGEKIQTSDNEIENIEKGIENYVKDDNNTVTDKNPENKLLDEVYKIYTQYVKDICGEDWMENNKDNYLTKYELNELVKIWPLEIQEGIRKNNFQEYIKNNTLEPYELTSKFFPNNKTSGGYPGETFYKLLVSKNPVVSAILCYFRNLGRIGGGVMTSPETIPLFIVSIFAMAAGCAANKLVRFVTTKEDALH